MTKKITLGIVGLVFGLGLMFAPPAAHAATTAPEADTATRAVLGQALSVLQSFLNQIDARLSDKNNPITDRIGVSAALGEIKSQLITINAQLGGYPIAGNSPASQLSGKLEVQNPLGSLSGFDAKEPAAISWFAGPKVFFVLLPVLLLLGIAISTIRKREEVRPERKAEVRSA